MSETEEIGKTTKKETFMQSVVTFNIFTSFD